MGDDYVYCVVSWRNRKRSPVHLGFYRKPAREGGDVMVHVACGQLVTRPERHMVVPGPAFKAVEPSVTCKMCKRSVRWTMLTAEGA